MTNCVVAQEILSVLKSESITDPKHQKSEIQKLLPNICDPIFEMLVTSAALLTDYPKIVQTDITPVAQSDNLTLDLRTNEMGSMSYNSFLEEIISILGAEPDDLYVLAYYTLSILKNETLSRYVKHTGIENLLGKIILPKKFNLLESVGGRIFDESVGGRIFYDTSGDCGPPVIIPSGWDSDGPELNKEVQELAEMMGLTGLDSCPKKSRWEPKMMGLTGLDSCPKKSRWEPDGVNYEWEEIYETIDEHENRSDSGCVQEEWDVIDDTYGSIDEHQNGKDWDGVPAEPEKIYDDDHDTIDD